MIFSQALKVTFQLNGKTHKCNVDKMYIEASNPKRFYRVAAKSGNRDLICHEGQWLVCSGPPLRNELLAALGKGIEKALENDV